MGPCEPASVSAPTRETGKVTWAGQVVVSLVGKGASFVSLAAVMEVRTEHFMKR